MEIMEEKDIQQQQQNVPGDQVDDMTQDYLSAIKDLKQNSVDRSKYDALKAENKKLLDAVVNGQQVEVTAEEKKESIQELRKKVFDNPNQTNLEYVTNTLKLREAIMEDGGEDPFVPNSSQYTPNAADYAKAQKVAQVLQEMVDTADGDPNVFLNEYQRRVKETNIPQRKR